MVTPRDPFRFKGTANPLAAAWPPWPGTLSAADGGGGKVRVARPAGCFGVDAGGFGKPWAGVTATLSALIQASRSTWPAFSTPVTSICLPNPTLKPPVTRVSATAAVSPLTSAPAVEPVTAASNENFRANSPGNRV